MQGRCQVARMMGGENLWRGIHTLVLVQEPTNIARKLPVVGLPGSVQRGGSLFIGTAYRLPTECSGCDERRQLSLTSRDGDGLLIGAAVRLGNLATAFGSQPRPELDQCHARSGNPLTTRPARGGFGSHATRPQFAGKPFAETIELNRTGIEAVAIKPLGLNRQMDMGARRVGMEGQDIIVVVTEFSVGQRADEIGRASCRERV